MPADIKIPIDSTQLKGILTLPEKPKGFVLFVHGSGSSRLSTRNQFVAKHLNEAGFGTLLIDLLSESEDAVYETRFDIELLTERVMAITQWILEQKNLKKLALGLFGASTGAAAALKIAAKHPKEISAVVSRGGRPDMAEKALSQVKAPTLLIVGGADGEVINLNESAYAELQCEKKLEIVPKATHLFEEPGCLEQVAKLARNWFDRYLLI